MRDLPFVDEHAVEVDAPPEAVWRALARVLPRAFGGPGAERFARLVGCRETGPAGAFPEEGSAIVGFRVEGARPFEALPLVGRHRFSEYALVFLLEPLDGGARTRLRAQTWAAFPGAAGKTYRLLVIGTRGHVLVVRRLLRTVARRCLEAPRPGERQIP